MASSPLKSPATQRIDLLDILRGFAVLGIFVVNIEIMNCTFFNQEGFAGQWTGVADRVSQRLMQLFFYSKFFPIFSFLFGVGISMQALKRLEAGQTHAGFFLRRMSGLFIIGWLHITLLWSGDVLHLYALLGLLTASLLKIPNRILLFSSLILLLFPFFGELAQWLFGLIDFRPGTFMGAYQGDEIIKIIRHGDYLAGVKLRLHEYLANIPLLYFFLAPTALAMFLLGLYFGKNKLIYKSERLVMRLKIPAVSIALITNAYRLIFLFVLPETSLYGNEAVRPLLFRAMEASDLAMGLFYLWLIAWLVQIPRWYQLLKPLRYVGRMALSNYIMHSVIGLLLFSSLGLKLYRMLSPTATLLSASAVFIGQVILSRWWLRRYRYGPLEWLWRCFSYGRLLSIRKTAVANGTATILKRN